MTILQQQTADKVLTSISDKESLELFRFIATNNEDSEGLRTKTSLTRKQYYSRLSRMTKAGLVLFTSKTCFSSKTLTVFIVCCNESK